MLEVKDKDLRAMDEVEVKDRERLKEALEEMRNSLVPKFN